MKALSYLFAAVSLISLEIPHVNAEGLQRFLAQGRACFSGTDPASCFNDFVRPRTYVYDAKEMYGRWEMTPEEFYQHLHRTKYPCDAGPEDTRTAWDAVIECFSQQALAERSFGSMYLFTDRSYYKGHGWRCELTIEKGRWYLNGEPQCGC